MTRPIDIPPPGAPLVGLSPLLARIAAAAHRDDTPANGVFGRDGTYAAPGPQVSIGLFQLTSAFQSGTPSPHWAAAPGPAWHWATATRIEYYTGAPNTWNTPAAQADAATTPETVTVWAPAAMLQANAGASGEPVWCFYDEGPGCWVLLAQGPPRWTFSQNLDGGYGAALPAANAFTEQASPAATLPRTGTYLASFNISLGEQAIPGTSPSVPATFFAQFCRNHVLPGGGEYAFGHFHADDAAPGQVSYTTILSLTKNDVITVAVGSPQSAAVVTACNLTLVLLGP